MSTLDISDAPIAPPKEPVGRPPKLPKGRKRKQVNFPVTFDEYRTLRKRAKEQGCTVPDVVALALGFTREGVRQAS